MNTLKPVISDIELSTLFTEKFDIGPSEYEPIDTGETSQAYYFTDETGGKVLRLNASNPLSFQKDAEAAKIYSTVNLPIPKTYATGELYTADGIVHYSVTARAAGNIIKDIATTQPEQAIGSMLQTLAVLAITPPVEHGYGWWNPSTAKGMENNWHDAIRQTQKAGDRPEVLTADFHDLDLRHTAQAEINTLLQHCPDDRFLIHGDFSTENVLVDNEGATTGVIDWFNSMYGDPLYDAAWLNFGSPELDITSRFRATLNQTDQLVENYDDRLRCYQILIGINAMAFFAKFGEREKYFRTHSRTADVINA